MYSNFVTPPDFVEDNLPTVTLIDCDDAAIESIARLCAVGDECFNVYVYRSDMNDKPWLDRAIDLSEAVILNLQNQDLEYLCANKKTYYYGAETFLCPATKITIPDEYFIIRKHN